MLALVLIWHQPKSETDSDATYLAIMKSSLLPLLHFWQVIVTKWLEDKLFLEQKHQFLRRSLLRPKPRPRRPKRPRNLQQQKEQVKFTLVFFTLNSMTSLLPHTVAQPTKWRFLPKLFLWMDLRLLGYEATKITKIWFSKSIFFVKNQFYYFDICFC